MAVAVDTISWVAATILAVLARAGWLLLVEPGMKGKEGGGNATDTPHK
jgi:hypothetical protein